MIRAVLAGILLLVVLMPRSARAWGQQMHEIVNRRAAEMLPGPAGDAWRPLARRLGMHASDADHRKSFQPDERPRHFIDIDAWDEPPFDDVPRTLEGLVKKHGREQATHFGIVPWAIEECYRMVVLSLRRGDWASAGAWAADLGHYVADSHQPLHCTINYDGQTTGNDGIHLRYEITMMDRFFDEAGLPPLDPLPDVPPAPVDFCFGWIAEAYPGVEQILAADDAARASDPDFGDRYYDVLWERSGALGSLQMSRAVRDLAVLYAAAWEEAGRPAPPDPVPAFRALTVAELDPAPVRSSGTARSAWIVAGAAILSAFVLGNR